MSNTIISTLDLRIRGKVFSIFSLSGHESLYKPFCFDISLLIYPNQWENSWLLAPVQILLPNRIIAGIITQEFIQLIQQDHLLKISCRIEPKFSLLRQEFNSNIFLQKNIIDVFKEYSPSQAQLLCALPENKYFLFEAPQESYLDFLKRLFSHQHYFFWFDTIENHQEIIYIGNSNEDFLNTSEEKVGHIINGNLITDIYHYGSQPSGPAGEGLTETYHTDIHMQSITIPFYWMPVLSPSMPNLFTAHIESENTYAELNEDGQYTHRLKLDMSNTAYTQAMPQLKRITPYSGLHFPLQDNAEILLSHLYGNSHEPVIVGSLHNKEQSNPVTSQNFKQHIFKSQAGNFLCADDNSRWIIQNANSENLLELNTLLSQITLQSKGNINFSGNNNIIYHTKNNLNQTSGNNLVQKVERQFSLTTLSGNINHQSKLNYIIENKNNAYLNASQNILFESAQKFILNSQNNLSLTIQGEQFSLQSQSGNIIISSGKDLHITGKRNGNITISNGEASIEITQDGTINLTGSQISLSGQPLFSVQPG
jgi:hypothetical protein